MNEIEVKILDIDRDKIRRILTVHGATKAFDGTIVSHFFRDTKGQKIRLRRMGKKCFLTAKVKLDHEEVSGNEEFEVEVSDFFTMSQILLLAGLEKYGESIKSRESYHL